ncbi:MAG: FHA domain-containing protein [Pseudomonadales bacterium]|nr:FHA domain-containing protein [Pseudomonadales bacterium]
MEDATLVQPASSHLMLRSEKSEQGLTLAGEMLVGREVECQVQLDSGHISRYHAKISVSPNGIFVEDLKSTNGTFVNGRRIRARERIGLGDEVAFHELKFRIVSEESGDEDATLMGGEQNTETPVDITPSPTDTNPQLKAANVTLEAPSNEPSATTRPAPEALRKPQLVHEQGENTQLLSATHLNRLVTRSQHAQKDVKSGSGARILIMTAPLRGKHYALEDAPMGTEWLIGRDDEADIQLNDKTISARHAKLGKVPNGYLLTAVEAKNGMIINGQSETRYFLSHGDRVQLGRIEIMFKNDRAVPQPVEEDDDRLLSEQLKNTRRLVMGAIATLTILAAAVILNI